VLKGWGAGVMSQIEEVSIDLSGNYRILVKKMLPNAGLVADMFPVMKLVNAELNRARNQENRAIETLKNLYQFTIGT
jgi:transposase